MRLLDRRRSRMLASLALGVLSFLSSALLAEPPKPRPANADKLEDAQSLLQDGKYNEAVKVFKEADKLANGSCVECRIGLARAFNKLGAYKEVLKNIDSVLGLTAETNDLLRAFNEQGVALVALAKDDPKQLEKAEKAFRKILELKRREGQSGPLQSRLHLVTHVARRGGRRSPQGVPGAGIPRPRARTSRRASSRIPCGRGSGWSRLRARDVGRGLSHLGRRAGESPAPRLLGHLVCALRSGRSWPAIVEPPHEGRSVRHPEHQHRL